MAQKPSADKRYLELNGNVWRVTMAVPRELQDDLGTRLKRPLHTDSLALANALKWDVVAEFRRAIDEAKAKRGTHSLQREAVEASEHLRRARPGAALAGAEDGIVERAEQLLGAPIRTEPDPITREPVYIYDAAREARAEEYAEIAFGKATPIGLHHDAYLAGSSTKLRTQGDDKRAVKYLLTWCARNEVRPTLQAITKRTAAQFMDEIVEVAGGQSPRTLNKYLGRLSHYWQWLNQRAHLEDNPWAGLRIKGPMVADPQQERAFTDEEVAKLLSGPANAQMYDLMRIAALSGARLDAIVDLSVKDCGGGYFSFKPQKKETKRRDVPIHSDLRAIIERRIAGKSRSDSLFPEWPAPKKAGSQRERSFKASNHFTDYRRSVGVDDVVAGKRRSLVNFHSFRRWFVSKAEQAGQMENIVAAVVGHKRPGITFGTYARGGPAMEQLRQCVESVRLPGIPHAET